MVKKMSDDDVMNFVYGKMFGDMDEIESKNMFDGGGMDAVSGTADNAKPQSQESGGMKLTIEPIMKAAEEGGRKTDFRTDGEEEEEDDKMKGISDMSPLMAQLHGKR